MTPHLDNLLFIVEAQTLKVAIGIEQLREDVVKAYLDGASWKQIGEAVGTSTQAAWERYREDVQRRLTG